ncbi:hypothetical protein GCM10023191_102360 [Actinoallomurus oryzae]|uniref:Pycsar effector protein domain-containing protein n=1 Tax=Actinoallomurus oryzae TaxID=502180 RepID=A0ABP8R9R3_9ACTN
MKYASLLKSELAVVRAELTRVDAKCQTLAGLSGAAAAFTATQVAGHGPGTTRWTLGVAGVLLAAATVLLLTKVLRPHLGISGFCQYADLTSDEAEALFTHGCSAWHREQMPAYDPTRYDPAKIEADDIELIDLIALSRLVRRKYRWLRRAIDLSVVGVVFIGLGVLAGAIA